MCVTVSQWLKLSKFFHSINLVLLEQRFKIPTCSSLVGGGVVAKYRSGVKITSFDSRLLCLRNGARWNHSYLLLHVNRNVLYSVLSCMVLNDSE